jgi:hypothetical protein
LLALALALALGAGLRAGALAAGFGAVLPGFAAEDLLAERLAVPLLAPESLALAF